MCQSKFWHNAQIKVTKWLQNFRFSKKKKRKKFSCSRNGSVKPKNSETKFGEFFKLLSQAVGKINKP